jgi:hypothetical protein
MISTFMCLNIRVIYVLIELSFSLQCDTPDRDSSKSKYGCLKYQYMFSPSIAATVRR